MYVTTACMKVEKKEVCGDLWKNKLTDANSNVCNYSVPWTSAAVWKCADIYETKGKNMEEGCMKLEGEV